MSRRQTRRLAGAVALLVVAAAAVGWGVSRSRPPSLRGMALVTPHPAPDFTLTNDRGEPFHFGGATGKASLVFFGYTFCPDVCPGTMVRFQRVREALGGDAGRVQFLFVTVDPERDDPDRLRAYLAHFDPAIVGLTGPPEALERVWREYGVVAEKVPLGESGSGYLVNHTATVYLVDPAGRLRVLFAPNTPVEDMVHDVRAVLSEPPGGGAAAIRVEKAWARPASAMPGGGSHGGHGARAAMGSTSAVYLVLVNRGAGPDALVGVRTDAAEAAELHETRLEGQVMGMRPLPRLPLAPGERVELRPGGLHIMLMGLKRDLHPGDRLEVVLLFEKAGEIPVEVEVREPEA